ncbi:MAG: hypothetical protein QE495_01270 [Acidovorax sp.]|uniref:hypothetical protein n=1 Tax=Acidovorax sp. TaxID=1872122 RepID=UPI002602FBBB|nr:hypothetical protein [Acidovorax sp.]MDH4425057.1 hypothetical protein [Acidovorax sp.]
MIPARLYTYVATALVAAALASFGTYRVQEWRWQANTKAEAEQRAEAERIEREARDTDARQQRQFNDTASGKHAARLATLSTQLGDARAQIARLSDRQCLDAGTVRMLNNIGTPAGGLGLRTPAGKPSGAAAAAASAQADAPAAGYASERDTADWIATCKVRHDALADQVNSILDIEERRQQGAR